MTETKWTPGPWEASIRGSVLVPYRLIIDQIPNGDMAYEETLANAHLIAAAPDLYEALVECQKWLEESAEGENATCMAFSALAKARGESND